MTTVVKLKYRGMGQMLTSEKMQAAMEALAIKVRDRAVATAPVDETGPHPGRYKAAFKVSHGVKDVPVGKAVNLFGPTKRAYGRVSNDAPEALYVEYGSKNNPRHRTLGRALDALKG